MSGRGTRSNRAAPLQWMGRRRSRFCGCRHALSIAPEHEVSSVQPARANVVDANVSHVTSGVPSQRVRCPNESRLGDGTRELGRKGELRPGCVCPARVGFFAAEPTQPPRSLQRATYAHRAPAARYQYPIALGMWYPPTRLCCASIGCAARVSESPRPPVAGWAGFGYRPQAARTAASLASNHPRSG